jgi:hypothetical protein
MVPPYDSRSITTVMRVLEYVIARHSTCDTPAEMSQQAVWTPAHKNLRDTKLLSLFPRKCCLTMSEPVHQKVGSCPKQV